MWRNTPKRKIRALFQAELACLLGDPAAGAGCGLRRPDVLVVNTGMHDMALPFPAFAMAMRELAARLRALQVSRLARQTEAASDSPC